MKYFVTAGCLVFSALFAHNDDIATYHSTYLEARFLAQIDKNQVNTVFELGALHGLDSILLQHYYNCPVYAFECNPFNISRVRRNLDRFDNTVVLIEKAVAQTSGKISFYPSTSHPSTSSMYQYAYESMEKNNQGSLEDLKKTWVQTQSTVDSIRLDDFMTTQGIDRVDLLCIDIQGGTLPALRSLGRYISTVKYVICEVEYSPIYTGEALFHEIEAYMKKNGFICLYQSSSELWGDVLFVRKEYLKR